MSNDGLDRDSALVTLVDYDLRCGQRTEACVPVGVRMNLKKFLLIPSQQLLHFCGKRKLSTHRPPGVSKNAHDWYEV